MSEEFRKSFSDKSVNSGPYLAKIVSHIDPAYMGTLEVQLLKEIGNTDSNAGQLIQAKYLSPFYGVTNVNFVKKDPDDYNNTQKSYGMWMVPPDVGTLVVVIFIEGNPANAFWIGCVQDERMNFMLPGYAATKYAVPDTKKTDKERVPVAEYNKIAQTTFQEASKYLKPAHPIEEVFDKQGLLEDDIRGITTSSARREVPSMVFGISTPGPVDKRAGAIKGKVGKTEHKIVGAFVSRLGGSSFVMDDGDDKYLRKTKASDGPPEYAAVEQDETDGEVTIPHNELIRFRTRTGHQILLHNSEDLIYIGNARGTAWIELTSDGKIDIYAEDSISVHTKQDFNLYADRDINFEAGRNINIKSKNEMQLEVVKDWNVIVGANSKLKVIGNYDIKSDGNVKSTAKGNTEIKSTGVNNFSSSGATNIKAGGNLMQQGAQIHLNGPAPAEAAEAEEPKPLKTHSLPDELGKKLTESILCRIPTHEPYVHHENLDPLNYKPEKLDRDAAGRNEGNNEALMVPPPLWKKYSTKIDTFEKATPPNQE